MDLSETTNVFLHDAVVSQSAFTWRGVLERIFTFLFSGLVYNQTWEDPAVDLAAMNLGPDHSLLMIASAGCNVLNYLEANPKRIIAVDLNANHVALSRLRLAALRNLPNYEAFFRFFGVAKDRSNCEAYDKYVSAGLDRETREYWGKRSFLLGRRINMFARNLYRYGLVGRFVGFAHAFAGLHGKRLQRIVEAGNMDEQRAAFDRNLAPLCDHPLIKMLSRTPLFLYAVGVPPSQHEELVEASDGNLHKFLRSRVENLACKFPVNDNYFAWQVFARSYDLAHRMAVPPYLRSDVYDLIRTRTGRVAIHHTSIIDFLKEQPAHSIDRFVLLDSQDWMTPDVLAALWEQINRVANPRASRVIFRTAGRTSLLPRKLPASSLSNWVYLEQESRDFHEKDRASIFGGFHIYERKLLP
jgi:S-adenosylmethionine-diacylglycerol 3-amino-3-carboxypropyl transferase